MSRGAMVLFLALIASALRPARGQVVTPSQIAGCYTVSIGLWSPALGRDAPLHAIPSDVRLDTVPVAGGGGWRLSPDIQYPVSSAVSGTPRWQMEGDDVRLTWSNGATLTIVQLDPIPDPRMRLEGEAAALSYGHLDPDPGEWWWVRGPPGPRAPAHLEPRPCGERGGLTDQRSSTARAEGVGTIRPWSADVALANRVAGCYEVADGAWQTDSALAKIQPVPRGPVRFELTKIPDRGSTRLSAGELKTYFETRSLELFSTWVRVSDTEPSIIVSRPLPMAGFALDLTLHGTDLVGSIIAFTDAIPPDGKRDAAHAVTARRIPCSLLRR